MNLLEITKKHLDETGMNYWQHLGHSIKQSSRLFVIAIKSIIHGIFPWWYASSGPVGIYKIYQEIRKMHHVQKLFRDYDKNN
jgi:hypothetical protein